MIRASTNRKTPINRGFSRGSYIQKESEMNIGSIVNKNGTNHHD